MENMILAVLGLAALGAAILLGALLMSVLSVLVSVGVMPFAALLVVIDRGITALRRWHRSFRAS